MLYTVVAYKSLDVLAAFVYYFHLVIMTFITLPVLGGQCTLTQCPWKNSVVTLEQDMCLTTEHLHQHQELTGFLVG